MRITKIADEIIVFLMRKIELVTQINSNDHLELARLLHQFLTKVKLFLGFLCGIYSISCTITSIITALRISRWFRNSPCV
jgi:hypothetical protein